MTGRIPAYPGDQIVVRDMAGVDRQSAMWAFKTGCAASPNAVCPFEEDNYRAYFWRLGRDGRRGEVPRW